MSLNHYIQSTYTVAIEVSKSPGDVFNRITRDISKFWPEKVEGKYSGLNDEFIFRSGRSHFSKNKVIEFVPDKKIVWLVLESRREEDNFDWAGTKIIFELMLKGSTTVLQFTYDGVVLENEADRLKQVCDLVIKENLYNLIESYTVKIAVENSPRDVFNAITAVPNWWSRDFEGNSSTLNDEFIIHHPQAHYSKQKLIEVIPDKKIVWLVTQSRLDWLKDQQEWTNTKMVFEIINEDSRTQLCFTHYGLVPEKECYERCEKGWNLVIKDQLFNYIIKGRTI